MNFDQQFDMISPTFSLAEIYSLPVNAPAFHQKSSEGQLDDKSEHLLSASVVSLTDIPLDHFSLFLHY